MSLRINRGLENVSFDRFIFHSIQEKRFQYTVFVFKRLFNSNLRKSICKTCFKIETRGFDIDY